MGASSIEQMAARVAALMEERLRARGDGLAGKLSSAGRRLPRRIRTEAEFLAQSAQLAANPALYAQLDHGRVAQAYDTCLRHLKREGRWQRLSDRLINVAGRVAFVLLAVLALVAAVLWWRGLV